MNCYEFNLGIEEYLSTSLDPRARPAFERHAASCGHCRARLERMREALKLFSNLPVIEPEPGFSSRVMKAVQSESVKEERRFSTAACRRFWPALAAAGLCLCCLLYIAVFNESSRRQHAQAGVETGAKSLFTCQVEKGIVTDRKGCRKTAGLTWAMETGESIDVAPGGRAELAYGEFGVIVVEGGGRVVAIDRGLELQSGRAFFDLNLDGRSFDVYTRAGRVHVIGTVFEVAVLPGGKVVTKVARGTVWFTGEKGRVVVRAGHMVIARPGTRPVLCEIRRDPCTKSLDCTAPDDDERRSRPAKVLSGQSHDAASPRFFPVADHEPEFTHGTAAPLRTTDTPSCSTSGNDSAGAVPAPVSKNSDLEHVFDESDGPR